MLQKIGSLVVNCVIFGLTGRNGFPDHCFLFGWKTRPASGQQRAERLALIPRLWRSFTQQTSQDNTAASPALRETFPLIQKMLITLKPNHYQESSCLSFCFSPTSSYTCSMTEIKALKEQSGASIRRVEFRCVCASQAVRPAYDGSPLISSKAAFILQHVSGEPRSRNPFLLHKNRSVTEAAQRWRSELPQSRTLWKITNIKNKCSHWQKVSTGGN